MKLVFVSNYYNHHVKPLCEALYGRLGSDFRFIATSEMRQDRRDLGYQQETDPRFVISANKGEEQKTEAIKLINTADVVIAGSAPEEMYAGRLRSNRLMLRYSERPFKTKLSLPKRLYHVYSFRSRDMGDKNVYMLCAGAYVAADFHSVGMYRSRTYKWGYFPHAKEYDPEELMARKSSNSLLWCGRFLDWKHPDDALTVAAKLKADGYDFCLNVIGTGVMKEELSAMADRLGLSDCVRFLGSMPPQEVRGYMEKAGVFLFTSDRYEGWGAVLNEAMNSGCAVAASHIIGSVPFLIKDHENGLIYESGNTQMLYQKVAYLLQHPEEQIRLGKNAYHTIRDGWNAETAASRVIGLAEQLLAGKSGSGCFDSGVCSRAGILNADWNSWSQE